MSDEISIDRITNEIDEIPIKSDNRTRPIDNYNVTITNRKKAFGILYGIGYNINCIIGADIFKPENIWILVQSPGVVLVLYAVCGIISFLGSSVYIELGIISLPNGVGEQKYITDAFYPKRNVGHVFSFVAVFVIFPGIIVTESYTSAQHLLYCFRGNSSDDLITVAVSITLLFIIMLYQMISNRVSNYINHALALIKIITLLFISVVGLIKLGTNHNNWNNIFNTSFNFGAYGSGLMKVLFTYEGWNNINYLIGELASRSDDLEYPSIILKYSSFLSVSISFLLYFLTNAAFITVVGYNINDNESTPIPIRFGKELFNETGEKLMSILIAISAFGCASAMMFTYSRIINYAIATGFMPIRIFSWLVSYSIKFDSLINHLSAQFFYCLILSFIFLIKNKYNISDICSTISQYSGMIYHGTSALCLYILKRRLKNMDPEIFSISIYMIIIYLIIIIFIIIASFVPPGDSDFDYLIPYCISWSVAILGLIIWYIRNRNQSNQNRESKDEMNVPTDTNIEIFEFLNNTSLQSIPFDDLKIIKEIGKGGFATVFLAKCNLNGSTENVALKFLRGSQNNFEAFLKELNVYYNLGCKEPTFLKCYGISKDIKTTNDYILVMQYAPMGSLRQNLCKVANIEWKEKLELLSYIALDLKMMHSHGIIHRDLHSGNILQNKLYNAYIGDLGLAETVNKALAKSNGIYGVFPYIAPEVLRRKGYTSASDVYSFGIIMWEVSSGKLAFSDKEHDLCFLTEVCDGLRPTVAKGMPRCYVDLMKRCWDNDPEKRPMASEIYEVIQSWKNNYEILLKFNKFETILEKSGAMHPQAVYTSRFISLKELEFLNSRVVCTEGIINDDDKIIQSQENNKIIESQGNNQIIESQEDNIPIERMIKLML